MKKAEREDIKVWRNKGADGIEFRRGVAVAEPYPRHWHDEYQLCLITTGGGEINYRGVRHETPASGLFIVHPGEVHSNNTTTGCSFLSTYIEPRVFERIQTEVSPATRGLPFFRDTVIFDRDVVSNYLSLHRASEDDSTSLERESCLRSLMFRLISAHTALRLPLQKLGREPEIVERVRDYIVANHERTISLSELEQITGFSLFHISRVFSKAVGIPPHEFQTHVRVAIARKLIRGGDSLANAAAAVGFADQSHFHRHFRRLMKVTPGEYFKASKNVQ